MPQVAEGIAHVYPRLAPTCEWDTAAAHAIVEEAGGVVLQAGLCDSTGQLLEDWKVGRLAGAGLAGWCATRLLSCLSLTAYVRYAGGAHQTGARAIQQGEPAEPVFCGLRPEGFALNGGRGARGGAAVPAVHLGDNSFHESAPRILEYCLLQPWPARKDSRRSIPSVRRLLAPCARFP